jgi:hypothetical protein
MKNLFISCVLLGYITNCTSQVVENPQADISNGLIKAHLYLPDAKNGYYTATRFDWSGIIYSLEYKGHNYYKQWFEKDGLGPVDSFNPLNFNETKPYGTFVKIGIGALKKTSDEHYDGFTRYPIVDPGIWKINVEAAKIQFHHVLNDQDYPYEYTKTIKLTKGKPEMVISYILKNTGKRSIETQVFNHNFFVFDKEPIGPDFELTFQKNISGTGRGIGDIAEFHENKIKFKRLLAKNESVYCPSLEGINENVNDSNIKVENHKTGVGVRITGDQPLSKMVFWSSPTTVCPEPFITIKIEPGKVFMWSYKYDFFIDNAPIETKYK